MALDSRFFSASDLQSLFRDKDSGLPLRNGVVYFWTDSSRTTPKEVYKITGTPPNYSFVSIGAVVNLTSSGTFSDNENPANDIVPYYFPYQGTPASSDGTIEYYYVEVYSEGGKTSGVLQFTREAWPPNVASGSATGTQNLQNYIPNGQFKIHSNVEVNPDDATAIPGQISQATTDLAQGGWTFDRPSMSAAKDIVLFNSFGGYVPNPTASPTYYINIQNQSPAAGDAFKDLRIKFDDVNKFASDTDTYTFAFTGESNSGSLTVSLILIKHYGSDPEEEIALGNFTITNSFSVIQKSGFMFGANTGKAIGAGNYIQLALRFPTGSLFSVNLTDFILTPGNVTVTQFPQTTDREFTYESITPAIPAYDNSNLYLPVRLGAQGLVYDTSEVGEVVYESNLSVYVNSLHPSSNKMLADGGKYERLAFSPLGIPFNRLFQTYWDSTLNLPRYGTGAGYFIGYSSIAGSVFRVINNTGGIVTDASDGTPATGFTFTLVHKVQAPSTDTYYSEAYLTESNFFTIQGLTNGQVAIPNAGTSGFALTTQFGTPFTPQLVMVRTVGASGLAGKYFEFNALEPALTTVTYYVWFKVNGSGVDPNPGAANPILVDLDSTDTDQIVAQKIREALNAWQITEITTVAGSAVPAGSYFNISSTDTNFYVWYTKDSMGTDPRPAGKVGIRVDILSADTAAQVAVKTQQAINMKYFAVPDFRGYFLRGWANGSSNDPDTSLRYSLVPGIGGLLGDVIGTTQSTQNLYHEHNYTNSQNTPPNVLAAGTDSGQTLTPDQSTGPNGGYEARPYNKNVNIAIRY